MRGSRVVWFLAALLSLAGGASEAAEFGLGAIEGRAGIALPSDWDNGYSLGVAMDIGKLASGLYLYPGLRYARAEDSFTLRAFPGGPGVDRTLSVTDIALGAEVRFFPAKEQKGWYFGGGAYLHFLTYEESQGGDNIAEFDTNQVGPAGVGGFLWKRDGGLSLFAEARVDFADVFDRGEVLVGVSFHGK